MDDDKKLVFYDAQRNQSLFAVVFTIIDTRHHETLENQGGVFKIDSTDIDIQSVLVFIPLEIHHWNP